MSLNIRINLRERSRCSNPRYNRESACIIAPIVCGGIGIFIINSGLFYIRRASRSSRSAPQLIPIEVELQTQHKIEKRLAVCFNSEPWGFVR
jgi:hypothetical protein